MQMSSLSSLKLALLGSGTSVLTLWFDCPQSLSWCGGLLHIERPVPEASRESAWCQALTKEAAQKAVGNYGR